MADHPDDLGPSRGRAAADTLLPPSRRRLLVQLWAAVTAFLAIRAFAAGVLAKAPSARGPAVERVTIDVNRASVAELTALPGIGRTRAEAIVLFRVRHGPFPAVDRLAAVDGIGPETLAGLCAFATATAPR